MTSGGRPTVTKQVLERTTTEKSVLVPGSLAAKAAVFFSPRLLQRQPGSGLRSPGHCWVHHAEGPGRPFWLEQHLPHLRRQWWHHGTSSCIVFLGRRLCHSHSWCSGILSQRRGGVSILHPASLVHPHFWVALQIQSTFWQCFVLFYFLFIFQFFFFQGKLKSSVLSHGTFFYIEKNPIVVP